MSEDLAENDSAETEACRREADIRDLLLRYLEPLTKRAVEDVAWLLGVSRAPLYRDGMACAAT